MQQSLQESSLRLLKDSEFDWVCGSSSLCEKAIFVAKNLKSLGSGRGKKKCIYVLLIQKVVKGIFLMMLEICGSQNHAITVICTLRVAERAYRIRLVEFCR